MKKIALLLSIAIFCSCHKPIKKDDSLKNFITANTKTDSGVLHLDQFNMIKWDKLYIIEAYHGRSSFDDRLGEYSSEVLDTGIEDNEGVTIFALFDKDELVNITETGAPYSFHDAVKFKKNKIDYYLKKDAVFFFKRYDPNSIVKSFKPIAINK